MNRLTRILIAVVVCGGAVYGYWKVDVAPKRAEAAKLETEVATQEAQLAQTQALIQTYEGARAAYKDNYAKVVRLGKAIPSDDDTKSLVVQLDAAARRSNVDFDTLNVNGGGTPAGDGAAQLAPGAINAGAFSAMPFALSFSGDFATLGNFLARLERFVSLKGDEIAVSGRLMRVEKHPAPPGDQGLAVPHGLRSAPAPTSSLRPRLSPTPLPAAPPPRRRARRRTPAPPTTTAATGTDIR